MSLIRFYGAIMTRALTIIGICFLFLAAPAPLGLSQESGDPDHRDVVKLKWADPNSSPMTYEEFIAAHPETPFVLLSEETFGPAGKGRNGGGTGLFLLLVNSDLKPDIQVSLDEYVADIVDEGYTVTVLSMSGGTPGDIRGTLAGYLSSNLIGALLVGDFPVPWYEVSGETFPCDLYYMDLDGDWIDSEPNGVFDIHQNNEQPEIFVGRLTASPLDLYGMGSEQQKVNRYFGKIHDYRMGLITVNRRALSYPDDDWSNFNKCGLGRAFDDVTVINDPATTTGEDYKLRLRENYEWIHVCVHSYSGGHAFSPSGWVYSADIYNIDPIALFYNLFACSNCRYVESNYMGGWYIFAQTHGLAAVGSTKSGSMLDFRQFYDPIGEHKSIGQAFLEWWISQHPYGLGDQEWYYGMTLLGDPLLVPGDTQIVSATPNTLSASNPGDVNFDFELNEKHYAYRDYQLYASVSGRSPRSPLENILVPLVFDQVTNMVINHSNSPVFKYFSGTLDWVGDGFAILSPARPLGPAWVGRVVDFSLVVTNPADYASQPVSVLITP